MINRTTNAQAPAPSLRRFIATLGIAVVLILSASTVSPTLHDWLHAGSSHDASDQCAVVLFASGVTLAAAAIAVAAPALAWQRFTAPAVSGLFLASPRYLRQPERGPPVC